MQIVNSPDVNAKIARFEQRYRNDHLNEHGLLINAQGDVIAENTGNYDSVAFSTQELHGATGGILSHTHPRALALSSADVAIAAQYQMTVRAVGVAPDSGEIWDHTIYFPSPSFQLASAIARAFEDEIELVERELSKQPYGDLQWQREARHLALKRTAQRFGFAYQRVQRDASLAEATRHERARLGILSSVPKVLRTEVWTPLHASLVTTLTHNAGLDNRIPIERAETVRQQANALVQRTFLGVPQLDGSLAPYTTDHGVVVPRSPYFRALWGLFHVAAQQAVDRHAKIMRRYLPPDLIQAYEQATLDPFDTSLAEADGPQYDPLHIWIGPDGKRLSDRIWNAAGDMRRKLDAYLAEAIAARKPVNVMAGELHGFLNSGTGGYEALRLARNETAAAGARADYLAGRENPLTETYSVVTSPRHQCCDNCDIEEQNSPYPKDDPSHIPIFHVNCLCTTIWNMVSDVKAIIIRLREQLEHAVSTSTKAIVDFISPLSKRFVNLLFRGKS